MTDISPIKIIELEITNIVNLFNLAYGRNIKLVTLPNYEGWQINEKGQSRFDRDTQIDFLRECLKSGGVRAKEEMFDTSVRIPIPSDKLEKIAERLRETRKTFGDTLAVNVAAALAKNPGEYIQTGRLELFRTMEALWGITGSGQFTANREKFAKLMTSLGQTMNEYSYDDPYITGKKVDLDDPQIAQESWNEKLVEMANNIDVKPELIKPGARGRK